MPEKNDKLFKMLADNTRLRCLMLMQAEGELCVCELTHALKLSQPKISRHLAHLRKAGVLVARRKGTWVYYRVSPELRNWERNVLHATLKGVQLEKAFVSDKTRLNNMAGRPGLVCCT